MTTHVRMRLLSSDDAATRHICVTERLKFGDMAAVYIHYDMTPDGQVVRRHISVPGKYRNKVVGDLLDAIAECVNAEDIDAVEAVAAIRKQRENVG